MLYLLQFMLLVLLHALFVFLSLYYLAADQNVGVLHKLFVGEGEVEMSSDLFLFHIFILSPFVRTRPIVELKNFELIFPFINSKSTKKKF